MNRFDIKECLGCDGYRHPTHETLPCDHYASMTIDEQCGWYTVVDNDIEKIRNYNGKLTFPELGEIVRPHREE